MDQFEQFLKYLDEVIPKTTYLTKNKERYDEVKDAVQEIADFVWNIDENAKIDVAPDELLGDCIVMKIITCLFCIDEMDKFCRALKKADSFEAAASSDDGNVMITIGFSKVFELAPPVGSKLNKPND